MSSLSCKYGKKTEHTHTQIGLTAMPHDQTRGRGLSGLTQVGRLPLTLKWINSLKHWGLGKWHGVPRVKPSWPATEHRRRQTSQKTMPLATATLGYPYSKWGLLERCFTTGCPSWHQCSALLRCFWAEAGRGAHPSTKCNASTIRSSQAGSHFSRPRVDLSRCREINYSKLSDQPWSWTHVIELSSF
jgi:hypothetical protein